MCVFVVGVFLLVGLFCSALRRLAVSSVFRVFLIVCVVLICCVVICVCCCCGGVVVCCGVL